MDLHEPFLRSIAEAVYDDAPRLIYADWLDDHGDAARAEFIRLQCELEPLRDRYEIPRACDLHQREDELLSEHREEWLGPHLTHPPYYYWDASPGGELRRGFVDTVSMPVRTFLARGEEVRRAHPTIRRVVLFCLNGHGERLAQCPALDGLVELELACWYRDADAQAVAASPHLRALQVLELWLGRGGRLGDGQLCRIMAASNAWPRLRELTLLDPDPETERRGKRLVPIANQLAGRKVAVYRKGYPDVFPFAADFWYTFPGHLPDGRMAMAAEDHRTTPPTLCVLTFDKKGKQTADVLTVPLPPDVLAVPVDEWYKHKDQMRQHLSETIGLEPGFIRIQDCEFPDDGHAYKRPAWEDEGEVGSIDPAGESSDEDFACGYGGRVSYKLRTQQWVFGWERYGDKEGRIHST